MINISSKVHDALYAPMRFITQRVLVYFDGYDKAPTDITEDVMSIDVLEELTSSSNLPFGEVSYNEASIELDNISSKYSITNIDSIYSGKLVANIRVKIEYNVQISTGEFVTVPGGIYYTDTWNMNSGQSTVTLTCYDKLFTVGYKPISRFNVQRNISFVDAYKMLMTAVGVKESEYIIDSDIEGTLDYFWCTDDSLVACLNSLALSTCCNVYVDKNDKIRIDSIRYGTVAPISITDSNLIISSKSSPSYANICSGVRVKYQVVTGTSTAELYKNDELELYPGINKLPVVFGSNPVVALSGMILITNGNCYVSDYTHNDREAILYINNDTDSTITASLTVVGKILDTVESSYFIEQNTSITNIMELTIPLVCSYAYVENVASYILNTFSSITGVIDIEMRGHPAIELGDIVYVESPSSGIVGNFQVLNNKTTMSEGLQSSLQVRQYLQEVLR